MWRRTRRARLGRVCGGREWVGGRPRVNVVCAELTGGDGRVEKRRVSQSACLGAASTGPSVKGTRATALLSRLTVA